MARLSLVVPMYNEQEMTGLFFDAVLPYVQKCTDDYEFIFVNDGSRDATLAQLKALAAQHPFVKIISLSRNFGKEAALTAGLENASGDAVIIMDADLQDPPELIPQFWEKFQQGFENIYGLRTDRGTDSFLKRATAQAFYKIYNLLADSPLPYNAGDCRLLSRRAVQAVLSLPERERFMKGLFSWVGYKSADVPFRRAARAAGKTKWNYWRLWKLALNGLTASTTVPLKLWTYFGVLVSLFAFVFAAWTAYKKIM